MIYIALFLGVVNLALIYALFDNFNGRISNLKKHVDLSTKLIDWCVVKISEKSISPKPVKKTVKRGKREKA